MMMRRFWPGVGTLIDAQEATLLVAVIAHEWPPCSNLPERLGIGSFGPIAERRAQSVQQWKINNRRREQPACSNARTLEHEFPSEVYESCSQKTHCTVKGRRVLCRQLHDADGHESKERQ